jgi:hypothetical protein
MMKKRYMAAPKTRGQRMRIGTRRKAGWSVKFLADVPRGQDADGCEPTKPVSGVIRLATDLLYPCGSR